MKYRELTGGIECFWYGDKEEILQISSLFLDFNIGYKVAIGSSQLMVIPYHKFDNAKILTAIKFNNGKPW